MVLTTELTNDPLPWPRLVPTLAVSDTVKARSSRFGHLPVFSDLPHLGEGLRRSLPRWYAAMGSMHRAPGASGAGGRASSPLLPACRFGCQDRDRTAYLPGPQVSGDFDRGDSVGTDSGTVQAACLGEGDDRGLQAAAGSLASAAESTGTTSTPS